MCRKFLPCPTNFLHVLIVPSGHYALYVNYISGSAMNEIRKGPISKVEEAWVESGFCAILVLFYEDPENPRLEALNKVSHMITCWPCPNDMSQPLYI